MIRYEAAHGSSLHTHLLQLGLVIPTAICAALTAA